MKNPTRHFIGVHLERAVIAFLASRCDSDEKISRTI